MTKIEVNVAGTKQNMEKSQLEDRARTAVRLTLRGPRHRHAMRKDIEALDKIDDAETRLKLEQAMKNATVDELNKTFDEFKKAKHLDIAPDGTKLAENFFNSVKEEANIVGSSRGAALFAGKFTSRLAAVVSALPLVNIIAKPISILASYGLSKLPYKSMGDEDVNTNRTLKDNNGAIFKPTRTLEVERKINSNNTIPPSEAIECAKSSDPQMRINLAKTKSILPPEATTLLFKNSKDDSQITINQHLVRREQDILEPETVTKLVDYFVEEPNTSNICALLSNKAQTLSKDDLMKCAKRDDRNVRRALLSSEHSFDKDVLDTVMKKAKPEDMAEILNSKYFKAAPDDVKAAARKEIASQIASGNVKEMVKDFADHKTTDLVKCLLEEGSEEGKRANGLILAGRDGALTEGEFENLIKLDDKDEGHKIRIALAENPRDYSVEQINRLKHVHRGIFELVPRPPLGGVPEALKRRDVTRQKRAEEAKAGTPEKQREKAKSARQLEESIHHAIIDAGDYEAVEALLKNPKQELGKDSLDKCANHSDPYIRVSLAKSERDLDPEQMMELLDDTKIDTMARHPNTGKRYYPETHLSQIGQALSDISRDTPRDLDTKVIKRLFDLNDSKIDDNLVMRQTALDTDIIDSMVERSYGSAPYKGHEMMFKLAGNEKQPLSDTAFEMIWNRSTPQTRIALAGCARDYSKAQKGLIIDAAKAGMQESANDTNKAIKAAWEKRVKQMQRKKIHAKKQAMLDQANSKNDIGKNEHNKIIEDGDIIIISDLLKNAAQKLSKDSIDKCASHPNPHVRIALTLSDYDLSEKQMTELLNEDTLDDTVKDQKTGETQTKEAHIQFIGHMLTHQRKTSDGRIKSRNFRPKVLNALLSFKALDIDHNLIKGKNTLDKAVSDNIIERISEQRKNAEQNLDGDEKTKELQFLDIISLDLANNEKQALSDTAFKTLWDEGNDEVKVALAGCIRDYSETQMQTMKQAVDGGNKAIETALQARETARAS